MPFLNQNRILSVRGQITFGKSLGGREGIGALGGIGASKQDVELEELGLADEIPSPLTAEEFNNLPKGTIYQHPDDPDGETRTKI